jgi:hypothetical protein
MADDFQYRPPAVSLEQLAAEGQQRGTVAVRVDPVQQAVDNYLLMERKARAWDALRASVSRMDSYMPVRVDDMDRLLEDTMRPTDSHPPR